MISSGTKKVLYVVINIGVVINIVGYSDFSWQHKVELIL